MVVYHFGMFFDIFVAMRFIQTIFCVLPFLTFGQNYFQDHFGGTIGIVANIGTHVSSIGLNLKGYYTDYFYQVNTSSTIYLHHSSYGGREKFWEFRNAFGGLLMVDKSQREIDFQLDALNHQSTHNYAVGYNYILYNDNRGTSQKSGGFGIHIKDFSLYHENDVFAGQAKDRFRTGHLYASYRYDDFKFGMGINLWTGETANSKWQRIEMENCPSGFRMLDDLPYGKTSHGIAYASVIYSPLQGQYAHLKLGIDSEAIRHAVQNRFIHDMIFLPKKVERTTPHYPRLDKNGCPVFQKEDVKKSRIYLQMGINDNWSN